MDFIPLENKKELENLLRCSVLLKQGRLNKEEELWENSEEFVEKRCKHSAVESAINAWENHGLDQCCDYGIERFKR